MDCEKFDRIVLDLLYDELDELTCAAAKRHMEHCTRCRSIGAELRATRAVGTLPLVDAPEGLELRILEAEQRATQLLPLGKRFGRGLSLLAGYAMRPQLSMAALLMLMIGSSLFFLRAQPGDREHVLVTERGVPESDSDSVAIVAKRTAPSDEQRLGARPLASANPSPPPAARADEPVLRRERASETRSAPARALPAAAPTLAAADREALRGPSAEPLAAEGSGQAADDGDASYDVAMLAYRDGRYSEAERRFEEVVTQGGPHAGNAALYAVQARRRVSGCPDAAPRFEAVHTRYPGSVGNDAAWQAADCYRSLGELARARQNYELLTSDPSYKARAREAIAELDQRVLDQQLAQRKAAAKERATGTSANSAAPVKPAAPAP